MASSFPVPIRTPHLVLAIVLVSLSGGAVAGPGPCSVDSSGVVATCSGDHSNGITNQGGAPDLAPSVSIVKVLNLSADIAPGRFGPAISIERSGDVNVNFSANPFQIITTSAGSFAYGIYASSSGGAVNITAATSISSTFGFASGIFADNRPAGGGKSTRSARLPARPS